MKFKIGDIAKIIKSTSPANRLGDVGEVVAVDGLAIKVNVEGREHTLNWESCNSLKLIKKGVWLKDLIKKFPNDSDLGGYIREHFN